MVLLVLIKEDVVELGGIEPPTSTLPVSCDVMFYNGFRAFGST